VFSKRLLGSDPIAATGRALKINSDARYRFERGVDPAFTLPGLELATQMILDLCGGEASEVVTAGAVPDTWRAPTAGHRAGAIAGRHGHPPEDAARRR
jgi:phenylalanyl-tRNA synthetase beta subunit